LSSDDAVDDEIESLLEHANERHSLTEYQQESENQQIDITIRDFMNIGTARSLQEFCKPFQMEILTLDFDDVCQMAMTVAKTLLGDQVDYFQEKVMEMISDIN